MPRLRHLTAPLVALALMSAPALAATAGIYSGHTSDKRPVSFLVSAGKVRSFKLQARFACSNHTGFVASATFAPMKIKRNRFKTTFHNKAGSLSTTITGVFRGRKATGTIRRRARFNTSRKLDPRGTLVCTVSTHYTAKH